MCFTQHTRDVKKCAWDLMLFVGFRLQGQTLNCEFIADSFDVKEKCLLWNATANVYRIIEDVLEE